MNEPQTLEQLKADYISLGWRGPRVPNPVPSDEVFDKMYKALVIAVNDASRAQRITRTLLEEAQAGGYDQYWVNGEFGFEINASLTRLTSEDRQEVASAFLKASKGTDSDLDLYLQRMARF